MTIKQRITLLIGLVIITMLSILGISQISTNTIIELEHEDGILTMTKVGMLTLRRNEKDFLARNDLKYLKKFEANHASLLTQVDDLATRLEASGIDATKAHQLTEILEKYAQKFRSLVKTQQVIGLHSKDGLYGSLRKAVHNAETLIKAQKNHVLLSEMLMLRRNEKDFMLREDMKYLDKFNKNFSKLNATLESSFFPDEIKKQIVTSATDYRTNFIALIDAHNKKGLSPKTGIQGEMRNTVHQTEELLEQLGKDINAAVDEQISGSRALMITIGLLLTILITAILIWLSRAILQPIDIFSKTMHQSANERDLTLRANINSSCEIGKMASAFNDMMGEFQKLLHEVAQSSGQVSDASQQLTEVTNQTLSGVRQQRVESEQVATAMNEMTATVKEVAQHAVKAADASTNADEEAATGSRVVAQSISGIQQLASEVENTATTINELEQESENIGTVLNVITGIAEQTNLLALNAAIEAARAGEQGRGFAVVADEVRTLAQRSQQSTEEIKNIIERLQARAQGAVKSMETGQNQAKISVEQAQKAGTSLQAIVSAIATIRDMNIQIASASEEQSAVAEEINQSVVRISQVAEDSALGAEQTSQTSAKMENLSSELQKRVNEFNYD